jgi:hypothetical protein
MTTATDAAGLVRSARAAGVRRDRAAIVGAARAWVTAQAAEGAWWAGSGQLGDGQFDPIEAGMLFLAGRAPAVSAAIAGRLVFVDAGPDDTDRVRLLTEALPDELDNYALRDLAWLRVMGADWRPLPPQRPRYGRVTGTGRRGDAVVREVLAAFAARDQAAIAVAIGSAGAFEGSRRFSLFAFALAEEAHRLGVDPGIAAYDF